VDISGYPDSFAAALRREVRRSVDGINSTALILAFNGCLAAGMFFWLPPALRNLTFTSTSIFALPVVIASWMLADVPATNVFGNDAVVMRRALDDPRMLRNILIARNLVLWALLAIPSLIVAVVVTWQSHDHTVEALLVLAVLISPFGSITFAMWLGARFPYHPVPLAERWEHRRDWRYVLRWLALLITPYVFVPTLTKVLYLPLVLVWQLPEDKWLEVSTMHHSLERGIVAATLIAAVGYSVGLWGVLRLARRPQLAEYLDDPHRG
jgi:hypothetical protein